MATAARLGSRVDAGLLAGCVVLSLIAIALPDREPRADRQRAAPDRRRAARRAAARRRALAQRLGARASASSSSTTRSSLRAVNAQALAARERPAAQADRARHAARVGLRARRGAAQHRAERGARHDAHADGGQHGRHQALQPGRRAGRARRHDPDRRPDDEHRDPVHRTPTFARARCRPTAPRSASSIRTPARVGGGDAYMLELRGVPTRVTLKPGTVIYTSGLGGTFPRGITIGTVVQEIEDGRGVDANVSRASGGLAVARRPACSCSRRSASRRAPATCGAPTVNADSATRRIAAAGDSLAKQAARAAGAGAPGGARLDEARDDRLGAPLARRAAAAAAADSAARVARNVPDGATGQPTRPARSDARRRDTCAPIPRESLVHELDRRRADDPRLRDPDRPALHAPAAARLAGVDRLPDRRAAARRRCGCVRARRRSMASCSGSSPIRSP